jgi:uncharacterized membrane protein HdeD (DUF308 family)
MGTLSVTMVLFFTNPLWSLFLSAYFLDEHLTWKRVVGVTIAVLGIGALINPLGEGVSVSHFLGVAAGMMGGGNNVLTRHLRNRHSARVIYAFQCLVGVICTLPMAVGHSDVPGASSGYLLLVAAVFGLLGQVTMNHGFRYIGAAEGGMLLMFEAILTSALGIVLFSLGTVVGLALALFMNWADLESRLFDPSLSGESVLRLRCPVLMGRDELVHVSASFRNPLERDVRYVIRAHVSEGHVLLMRQLDTQLPLPPGESERLEWEVTPADAAYGLFALVKVHQFRLYPLPGRQGSCGVVLVDFPLPGGLMFAIALGLTVLGMGGGYLLWARANRPLRDSAGS